MSTIVLGCDDNGVSDAEYQSTVASILEKAGHTVEKCAIEPNAFASYSDGSNGKNPEGKIGIYLIAAGTYSIADATYGTSRFKYNYFGIRPECSPNWECSDFDTRPIGADADCPGWLCSKIAGNSFKRINEIVKDKSMVVTGKDATEMGNNLVKAMGGEVDSSDSNKESTGSSIKEALKKAVSKWDGDVEIRLEDDTVHVRKIPDPSTAKITIDEFNNAFYDSITVTDINKDTTNKLVLKFKDYELTIKDDTLIKRFGVNKEKIEAEDDVKTLKEAKAFLQREWNKIRRDDGRQVELKVNGHPRWKTGIWCRVYLPSFFIDDYMYISKTSHDEDGSNNWNTSITLVDYPPSFGTYEEESEESTDATATDDTAAIDATTAEATT